MEVESCPHCQTRVVVSEDGSCPSCGFNARRDLSAAEVTAKAKAEVNFERARQDAVNSQDSTRGFLLLAAGFVVLIVTKGLGSQPWSPTRGTYFVASGPMLIGAILVIRSILRQLFRR